METLHQYRTQIDEIDKQIVNLLSKRMDVVKQVGIYKKQHNIPPLDQKRWQQVLQEKCKLASQHNLSVKHVTNIYNCIHQMALDIEETV